MTSKPLVKIRTVRQLRECVRAWRKADLSIGLVPTMGALHAGHLALVQRALPTCDRVIVSVFVNPTQFGPNEDFAAYPRDETADAAKLEAEGVPVMFAPEVDEVYGKGDMSEVTTVHVPGLESVLEGAHRPGHFTGVATVVAKLLNLCQPDHAFFGEKDFQQLQVITCMAEDLCIPTQIHGVATVREDDGLALSSRNAYLTEAERAIAPALYATLTGLADDFRNGGDGGRLELDASERLKAAGFASVDYVAIVDAETMEPLNSFDLTRPARVIAAARLGRARLIDNVAVGVV